MAIRLYLNHPLAGGQSVALSREQGNYLFAVMRLPVGAELLVFNGRDGEWSAEVEVANKRGGQLRVGRSIGPSVVPPDLWLLFAPIKKARTDFIVEKAVELGVRRLCPVVTEFTNSDRVRHDKLQANAIEAAEQCGATFVPEVAEPMKLSVVLASWPRDRHLVFCDEERAGPLGDLATVKAPAAILIGPEGGFSSAERTRLNDIEQCVPIGLGPRILRAETAALAALTLWQASSGDWT